MTAASSVPARRPWLGFTFAVAAAVGFSCKAILAKLAYRAGADAITVLGLRMSFALPAYMGMAWWGAQRSPRELRARQRLLVALTGVLGYYVASYLDFLGLMRISAGLERLILFLYPSIVVVFAALRARRRIAAREWQAMALGYVGIACVFVGDAGQAARGDAAWLGALCVFASSIAYSAYLVLAEGVVNELGSVRFTGLAMCCACLVGIGHFALTSPSLGQISLRALVLCATMAFFSTVLPTWLLSEAVRRIGAGRAALCGMIGPVTTVALEAMLLGEAAGISDAVGTGLVIASVLWLTRGA